MYQLYFDTCILNDFFTLIQYESGEKTQTRNIKLPTTRWTPEYIALYYLLDLDDQWELVFGTSGSTLQEIEKIQPREQAVHEKKNFLEDVYHELSQNWHIFSEPVVVSKSVERIVHKYFGPDYDPIHIYRAIQNGWEFFITTDFKTIINEYVDMEKQDKNILDRYIKLRSPLQFLEENLLSLPTLIRTLHGSWTDVDLFINTFTFSLDELRT